jgi:hypothetical protein
MSTITITNTATCDVFGDNSGGMIAAFNTGGPEKELSIVATFRMERNWRMNTSVHSPRELIRSFLHRRKPRHRKWNYERKIRRAK